MVFGELQTGDQFTIEGDTAIFTKINTVKISCCRNTNATSSLDANAKPFFRDDHIVSKIDELKEQVI